MEQTLVNTVALSLSEYNELRDFKKEMMEGKTFQLMEHTSAATAIFRHTNL